MRIGAPENTCYMRDYVISWFVITGIFITKKGTNGLVSGKYYVIRGITLKGVNWRAITIIQFQHLLLHFFCQKKRIVLKVLKAFSTNKFYVVKSKILGLFLSLCKAVNVYGSPVVDPPECGTTTASPLFGRSAPC